MNTYRLVVAALLLLPSIRLAAEGDFPVADGPYKASMDSLKQHQCPEWFRDAKFGIWAHWGPQAVPMAGDWYAKHMFVQGHRQYLHHLENYGHPSEHGYREIIDLWKAEKWDPDRLMALYKKAGARYFVSMGCHHDNFDLWNSRTHKWNAVNYGPRRDVVGDWQKAARKCGLKFGVSEHMGASFTWWQVSHGADKTGPKAGVPYEGAEAKHADLYHPPGAPDDKGWYSKNPDWHREWFRRVKDLVDHYDLDLLYTDGAVPFGGEMTEPGCSLIAHLFNTSIASRGSLQAVYTCKQRSEGRWVEDLERGVMPGINPHPWQTDTSIGDWYYNKNWKFRPVSWVIHMLADIVSKNGNLLLNVVQRPDGSLDAEVEKMLEELAAWIAVNGEAIYGTRPWLVYGEGPVRAKGGHFKEDFAYTAQDIRFTTRGGSLYAIALGWPEDGKLVVRSLAQQAGRITAVALLGCDDKLAWRQTPEGLVATLPDKRPRDCAIALKIAGEGLKPVPVMNLILPDAKGAVTLTADAADLHGAKIRTELQDKKTPNIGFWDDSDEWAQWKAKLPRAGQYRVAVRCATVHADALLVLEVGETKTECKPPKASSWADFREVDLGTIELPAGEVTVKARPRDAESWKAINLANVTLRPVK